MEDKSLTKFINLTLTDQYNEKELFSQMKKCIKSFQNINSDISKKIKQIKDNISNTIDFFPTKNYRMIFSNKVCFIIYKFFNTFMKYQSLLFKSLYQIQIQINEFLEIISNYLNQKIPIQIQIQEFLSYINDENNKSVQKLEFKLKSLFNYVKNLPSVTQDFCLITNKELFNELKKYSTKVDNKNEYISQNYFDLLFESYIESNHELLNNFNQVINFHNYSCTDSEFDFDKKIYSSSNYRNLNQAQSDNLILSDFNYFMNIIINKGKEIFNSLSKLNCNTKCNNEKHIKSYEKNEESKEFNFQLFECLIQKVYSQITSTNSIDQQMLTIIRCSSLRFLCNKYYIQHQNEWLEKINDSYIQNCIEIINQTPHDLKISKEIIPENLYDIKFSTLFLSDDFKMAIDKMSSIQFLICPIDIWHEVQSSIDLAMIGANKFVKNDVIRTNIAFDDFFSIVLPVFASAQILCPSTLHFYLSRFKKMKKTSSTDIIAISTVAITGYIGNNL